MKAIASFTKTRRYDVIILSYETFRRNVEKFQGEGCCDLLICDEAHRLKNPQSGTSMALASLKCTRRVLLTGTPMQNDLDEFFAMVNFTNPGCLGSVPHFRKYYQKAILEGREPDSTST